MVGLPSLSWTRDRRIGFQTAIVALLGVAAIVATCHYWLPLISSSARSLEEFGGGRVLDTWKRAAIVSMSSWSMPNDSSLLELQALNSSIKTTLEEMFVTVHSGGKDVRIFVRDARPEEKGVNKQDLLFLHGAAFSSKTWLDLGTLHLFSSLGFRSVAIDLPGFGQTRDRPSSSPADFMKNVIETLNLSRPVLVSPSMSGGYSIPLLFSGPPLPLAGYVPVAPVSTGSYTADQYKSLQLPTLIVYGSRDSGLGHQSLRNLKNMPNTRIVELKDAGHAAYMTKTDEFHKYLYNFLLSVAEI